MADDIFCSRRLTAIIRHSGATVRIINFKRLFWVTLQLLIIVPFGFASSIVIDMTFAKPGGSYLSDTNERVQCEALAPPRKNIYSKPQCAAFGSMETNPRGYAIAVTACVSLGALLWWSSRPGRGLRASRSSH